jgi:argininosuccinate lyase
MSKPTDPLVEELNASLPFDSRLYREDIDASLAWAVALARAELLSAEELESIKRGLDEVRLEFDEDAFEATSSDEDIHTAVERLLTERVGPLAGKLHTGRSRNDQVATDFRLWVMRACDRLESALLDLAQAMIYSAQDGLELPMPGYTHTRPAQPITWGYWVLAAFWSISRSHERFTHTRSVAAALPLGAGALAGTGFPIDRHQIAEDLGFHTVIPNSVDAVADRDFALEFLFASAALGVGMSRFAEALILFSSTEFGFVELDDAYTTGSSLMPHKKNPDPLELIRGKAGPIIGHLVALLATLKGLSSAYDKDLQEDKRPVFEAHDNLLLPLQVLTGLVGSLQLNAERMAQAITPEMMAVDLADYLVRKGIPFREAHDIVGKAVNLAEEQDVSLAELPPGFLEGLHEKFERDVNQVFNVQGSLERRSSEGGTAPKAVQSQLDAAKRWLKTAQRSA